MNISLVDDTESLINRILLSKLPKTPMGLDRGIGWCDKYFLIRAIHIFDVDITISESTDILVSRLGVSYKNICQSIENLSALGVVSVQKGKKERGRPVKAFQIHAESLLQYFSTDDREGNYLVHQPLIDSLLCWGSYFDEACLDLDLGEYGRSRRAYLDDTNHELDGKSRLMLSVLLANADEFGVVESLGHAEVGAMTGFSPDQQRRLVQGLLKEGYIRSVIKGFTHSKIFGRVETVYCLNTCKANITGQPELIISIFLTAIKRDAHEASEARQLFRLANPIPTKKKNEEPPRQIWVRALDYHNDKLVDLRHVSQETMSVFQDQSLIDYLQFRLESYATWFLELPRFNGNDIQPMDGLSDVIRTKIKLDVFPAYGGQLDDHSKKHNSVLAGQEYIDSVVEILCLLSWAIAKRYHQYLSRCAPYQLASNPRKLRVLPRSGKASQFAPLSLSIASLKMGGASSEHVAEYIHVRDHHKDILELQKALMDQKYFGSISESEFETKTEELAQRSKFSVSGFVNEEDIDPNIMHKCGLLA